MSDYTEFLARKTAVAVAEQIEVGKVNPMLHEWQREIVEWAVRTGRGAIWADTGLGKTFMQVEWARLSADTSLVVAPLAVTAQTVREASRLAAFCVRVLDEYDEAAEPTYSLPVDVPDFPTVNRWTE